jgi:mono/diheme cytochrome c family protein
MSTKVKVSSAFVTVLGVLALALIFFARAPVGSAAQAASPGSAGGKKKGDRPASKPASPFDGAISRNAKEMIEHGRQIFRFDTFGSEAFWGDTLQLHKAIAGEKNGGVGGGVSPKTALSVGLKVDADALPDSLKQQLKDGKVDLEDPAITLALLKLNSVVGVTGYFDKAGSIRSMGIQCAFCHSTVDDSFAPGIGKRLDGWAARDLNVGAIVSLAPNLKPFSDLLGVDVATVKKVLNSWGPGRYDAELDKDGKALRPDGKQAGTLIPPAFGLAGVNLHTWTGFGSVPYWNAYVAVTQMHGSGTLFDARFDNKEQFPVSAKSGSGNTRGKPDLVSSKLAALHFYELAIPAPKPPAGSFNMDAATRGKEIFNVKGRCATCHVPPLFTEPGNNLHAPAEVGVDSFQADRSPTHMYRTAPLAGLWSHQKGGFYHDGRFANLREVVDHYDNFLGLKFTEQEKRELIEYLKSL